MKNTARNLLEKLHGIGAALWVDGADLHYKGEIPPDVLDSLSRNKRDVIQLLNTMPVFTTQQERTLCDFYTSRPRAERLAMHRRGVELRRDRSWPFYVADLEAMREADAAAGKPSGPVATEGAP